MYKICCWLYNAPTNGTMKLGNRRPWGNGREQGSQIVGNNVEVSLTPSFEDGLVSQRRQRLTPPLSTMSYI